ncbi:MAG: choice-of-anchor tandem repeat GloVer-containing protein [Hyphomicrobiales bacterium]
MQGLGMTAVRLAALLGTIALAAATLSTGEAQARVVTRTVKSFNGADGKWPSSALVRAADGVLYGTTRVGGDFDKGTVFSLTPSATGKSFKHKVLYSFTGLADGSEPMGDLIIGPDGELFGTAWTGGSSACGSCGTVFALIPPVSPGKKWTENTLHTFAGAPGDGSLAFGGLLAGNGGVLFGTTQAGGKDGHGTVYQLTPPPAGQTAWPIDIIANFKGTPDGDEPWAALSMDADGRIFGTTVRGGETCECGTAFMLTPNSAAPGRAASWTKTILRRFKGKPDGEDPYSKLLIGGDGALYGTTFLGGDLDDGTVFRLIPQPGGKWSEEILTSFDGLSRGPIFTGALAVDSLGALYGTTQNGGTVFKLSPPATGIKWRRRTLHTFNGDGDDGFLPDAAVIFDADGRLLGTTVEGGANFLGAVFVLKP